jgi:hypothetical protein
MPQSYILSSHGGAYQNSHFFVPDRVVLHFYSARGTVLSNNDAIAIILEMQRGTMRNPTWSATAGEAVPKYECWDLQHPRYASGLYRFTGELLITLVGVGGNQSIPIISMVETITQMEDSDQYIFHCLCCTTTSAPLSKLRENSAFKIEAAGHVDKNYKGKI